MTPTFQKMSENAVKTIEKFVKMANMTKKMFKWTNKCKFWKNQKVVNLEKTYKKWPEY
jgi:hypothetical protein